MANLIEKIKDRRAPAPETPERRDVPVAHPDPQQGLTSAQVRERADAGWTNAPVDPPGKTAYSPLIYFICRSSVQKIFDVVRNYAHKAFSGFNGRPCNVGGDDAIFCPHKNAVLNHRLNLEGVDCRTAEVTAFECLKQIFFNHNTASCRVYEQCTLFHFGKGIFVKHIFRLWI